MKRLLRGCAAAAVAMMLMQVTPAPARATTFGNEGLILFQRMEDPRERPDEDKLDAELYVISPDGGEPFQLTHNDVNDYGAAWSPDGSRIAFGRSGDIWTMSPFGDDEVRLTDNESGESGAAWSPDGTRLLFVRAVGPSGVPGGHLYEMPSAGGTPRRFRIDGRFSDPAWSPDGRRIALVRYRIYKDDGWKTSESDLYVMRRNGTGLKNLTPGQDRWGLRTGHAPDWSRDGRRIAFASGGDGCGFVYVIRPNGEGQRQVTPDECGDNSHETPSWSPRGDAIAYVSSGDTGACGSAGEVRIVGLGGRPDRVLQSECTEAGVWGTSWQPLCTIEGTDGDDTLVGTRGRDLICGGEGHDAIAGGPGMDLVFGGGNNDDLYGGPDADVLSGGDGDDKVGGGSGRDWLADLLGLDVLLGHKGDDTMDAEDGSGGDKTLGAGGRDVCKADSGDERNSCI